MRAVIGLVVAAAVLAVGALPALALVLDDDPGPGARHGHMSFIPPGHDDDHPGRGHAWGHGDGKDGKDPGSISGHRGQMWRGPLGGELPPRVEKCLRGAPEGPFDEQRSRKGDSRTTETSPWKDQGMRTFARCLQLLEKRPTPQD